MRRAETSGPGSGAPRNRWLLALSILSLLAACRSAPVVRETPSVPSPTFPQPAPFSKVFVVVLENTDLETALAQPYLRQLASRGALLTNYAFVARPSQPNYLALTSGGTHGVATNRNVDLAVRHLGDLLEAKGRSWKSYAEDYPGGCFPGRTSSSGHYVRKHEPFLSYRNVQADPARCARVVEAAQLDADIEARSVPDFSLFIPDNRNNGHRPSDVAHAAAWLERTFGPRLDNPKFMDGMLVVVTFDESSETHTRPVYTVLLGAGVAAGATSDFPYDHYSLLRTIEEAFGLGTLGREDSRAVPIGGVWK